MYIFNWICHILKYNTAQNSRSLVFKHLIGGTHVTESEFLQSPCKVKVYVLGAEGYSP